MNFSQMHERLRLELLRRIQRGSLSVTLLARQTGFGSSHVSNFLRGQRNLSLQALDRILCAQHMAAADLLLAESRSAVWREEQEVVSIPVVSHASAMFEPLIRPQAIQSVVRWRPKLIEPPHLGSCGVRRRWERFVAVRICAEEAAPMEPLILPDAIVVLDRHSVALAPSRPPRPNLYGVRDSAQLKIRYLELQMERLVLRPYSLTFPLDMIALEGGRTPADFIAGRVVHIQNEP